MLEKNILKNNTYGMYSVKKYKFKNSYLKKSSVKIQVFECCCFKSFLNDKWPNNDNAFNGRTNWSF